MNKPLTTVVLIGLFCAMQSSCGRSVNAPSRVDWIISSTIDDRRGQLKPGKYRLIAPYVLGNVYGNPTSTGYTTASLSDDGSFELDLNQGHASMLADLLELEEHHLSDNRIRIDPSNVRFAMVSPFIVDGRTNTLGTARWVDERSGNTLRLLYFDAPARLRGHNFDVDVKEAGYVWVETLPATDEKRVVPRPENLVLAFTP
jgi:hypothetical protein